MLVYDQPINQAKPEARQAPAQAPAGFNVLDLIQLLWRRKIAIRPKAAPSSGFPTTIYVRLDAL